MTNVVDYRPLVVKPKKPRKTGGSGAASDPGVPTIRLKEGDTDRIVNEAEDALIAADRGLYQRAGRIVFVGEVRLMTADKRHVGAQQILERGDYALAEDLECAARFLRFNMRSDDWITTGAPMRVVKTLQDRQSRLRLPVLTGIVNAPTIRPDGSLLDRPGYDADTGLLFDPRSMVFPSIPDRPSKPHALRALETLRELLDGFPFVSAADRSVALSAILTALVRKSLRTAPLHAFTAPLAGSGKSTLVDVACAVATGREAGVIALGKSPEEMEKRLAGALLGGDAVTAIDNCEAGLGGEQLCQALTQPFLKVRALGRSEMIEIPTNTFFAATGNNLVLVGDMTRRALMCKLDPGEERPELRTFETRHPVDMVKADRGRYVAAALTILRAYAVVRRRPLKPPLGSFEEWCATVRDALLWLDQADPVDTLDQARQSDPKLDALRAVMSHWRTVIGSNEITAGRLIDRASDMGGFSDDRDFHHAEFREALMAVAAQGGQLNAKRLGTWLSANANRIVDGLSLCPVGITDGSKRWQLQDRGGGKGT